MTPNVGSVDRLVRVVAGVGLITYGVTQGVWWGWLGLIPLTTAALRWCPAYLPFGLSTCRTK